MNRVVVVGGGAAGLIAAWRSASLGVETVLLEKMGRLGTKILISGGGKCNVTHAGPIEQVRAAFRPNEAGFLKGPFHRFTNDDFTGLLESEGMRLAAREDGRIFPVPPGDAKDVVAALEAVVRRAGVRIRLGAGVSGLVVDGGVVRGVLLADGSLMEAARVVLATGGSSYPATGCTGDGWRWVTGLGHTVRPLVAALAPMYLVESPGWSPQWSGVALRGVVLRARRVAEGGGVGKERMRWRGDLLFTHKGVSGPTALGVSREVAEALPELSTAEVDLLPDLAPAALSARLVEWGRLFPRRLVSGFLEDLVPERLVAALLTAAGVGAEVRGAHLTAKERNRLVAVLKGWSLGQVRAVPLERGEVVAGGVDLSEVDARTMESRKVAGLHLCGEVLDIAGPVGGYNLQAAWSTGFVAGESAASAIQAG
jgi:predicted Rossmann fold flavoprotein